MSKKVFIVGGTGFIGYHSLKLFLEKGYDVTVFDRKKFPKEISLPQNVKIHLGNLNELEENKLAGMLKGYDAVVFSAGADDRITPKRPAYDFYYNANVKTAEKFFRIAKIAGIKKGVLISSYFAHFNRIWPEMKLAEHHPYIKSREMQEKTVLKACLPELEIVILELPYVFGSMPGKKPLWSPLVKFIDKSPIIPHSRGGTNIVSVNHIAKAIVGAVEYGKGGSIYQIGDENVSWSALVQKFSNALGKKKKKFIVPKFIWKLLAYLLKFIFFIIRKEGGLNMVKFVDLHARETFLNSEIARKDLKFEKNGVDKAIKRTVELCRKFY